MSAERRPTKRVRFSVAAVIRHPEDGSILIVRRPADDPSLGGYWGLPAVSISGNELPEDACRRIGPSKLGTRIEPVGFLGIGSAKRPDYELILMDIEARITGPEPDVKAATGAGTLYTESRWVTDLDLLEPATEAGSLCCRILLDHVRAAPR